MSGRTVLNEQYKGIVESVSIPAELHERHGKRYASSQGVVPIHCCTEEEIASRAESTHHYCDLFTDTVLSPLDELAYVRLDDTHAEKVFINRNKRLLLTSSDGRLAQWRCAPTFESSNLYLAGTPLVSAGGGTGSGGLVSLVTARAGNHYAVSSFEGDGGYFETPVPWKVIEAAKDKLVYGDQLFCSHSELRRHIASLPPSGAVPTPTGAVFPPSPVLVVSHHPRLSLLSAGGRQLAHYYLHGVNSSVEYL